MTKTTKKQDPTAPLEPGWSSLAEYEAGRAARREAAIAAGRPAGLVFPDPTPKNWTTPKEPTE
jgi:hypothetical protein